MKGRDTAWYSELIIGRSMGLLNLGVWVEDCEMAGD